MKTRKITYLPGADFGGMKRWFHDSEHLLNKQEGVSPDPNTCVKSQEWPPGILGQWGESRQKDFWDFLTYSPALVPVRDPVSND